MDAVDLKKIEPKWRKRVLFSLSSLQFHLSLFDDERRLSE